MTGIQHIAGIGQIGGGFTGIEQRCLINAGIGADADMQLDLITDEGVDRTGTELHFLNGFTLGDGQRPCPGKMDQKDIILDQVVNEIRPGQAAILQLPDKIMLDIICPGCPGPFPPLAKDGAVIPYPASHQRQHQR